MVSLADQILFLLELIELIVVTLENICFSIYSVCDHVGGIISWEGIVGTQVFQNSKSLRRPIHADSAASVPESPGWRD